MTNHEQMNDELRKLIRPRTTKHGKVDFDLMANVDGQLIFLTNVFKNGELLGWWSHSPWGTCNDQEQGWCLLSKEFEILDFCETKTMGLSAGNNFKNWRKSITNRFGKSFKLTPEWENSLFWKISET